MKSMILLCSLLFSLIAFGQGKHTLSIADINRAALKQLEPEKYVDSVDKLLAELQVNGNFYPKDTLLFYLKTYKEYVWKYPRLEDRKHNYYINIGNNVSAQGNLGEAIYFFEKADREYEKYYKKKPDFVLMKLCYLHTQSKNFQKAIDAYEKELPRLTASPAAIKNGSLQGKDVLLLMYILNPIASSYIFLKDTANTNKTIDLARNILNAVHKESKVGRDDLAIMKFMYYGMQYYRDQYLLSNVKDRINTIDSIRSLIADESVAEHLKATFDNNLTEWLINHFIAVKHIDSARYYLNKFKTMPSATAPKNELQLQVKRHELQIWSLENEGSAILPVVNELLQLSDTINQSLTNQMNDMMYAYTKAEFTEDELKKTELEKQKRTLIIIIVSLASIFSILAIYMRMRNRTKKTQKQIAALNHLTNLKIASMEASKQEAVRSEQERLAQELHDNFSSTLAALKHQTEHIYNSAADIDLKQKIEQVQFGLQHIYASLRNTSHQWFFDARIQQQSSFDETIRFLLDSALPDEHYKKHIQIDANAVLLLSLDDRINILRIIQEAITNVIKHSKANEISVFLMATHTELMLQISDNGIGFNTEKGRPVYGIGLQSIEKRVTLLKGKLEILNEEGIVLNIIINKKELAYFTPSNILV
ncbi:MAG: hypothetical protein JNM21_06170 [Taibaiella sp.]|nr:hypothetical protein [Taibaiella sp.]